MDSSICSEGCGREKDRTGDPAEEQDGVGGEDPLDRSKFGLSHLENLLLPLAFDGGKLDLAHTEQGLVDDGQLVVSVLHELVLGLHVYLGNVCVDGEHKGPGENARTEGKPADELNEKGGEDDELSHAVDEKELHHGEFRDVPRVHANQVYDG